MGAAPVVRGQLALPFVVAIGTQIIFEKISGRLSNNMIIQMAVVGLLLLFTIRTNIMKDNRLLYSDYVVRQQEYALTEKIIGNIEETEADGNCAVVILGQWSPQYNPSMIQGETLGRSFYEWDAEVPGGIETVSYTHLDVYKRQELQLKRRLRRKHTLTQQTTEPYGCLLYTSSRFPDSGILG